MSPVNDAEADGPRNYRSPAEENGRSRSPSPMPRDEEPMAEDDDNRDSPRGSE